MPVIPWIKKKKEPVEHEGTRDHNTAEENELLNLAIERFGIAESQKVDQEGRQLHQKWRDLDRMYRGNQWKGNIPEHKSTPVLNFTFSLVESIVPRMTDTAPEILVLARTGQSSSEFAKMLQACHSHLWYYNRMQQKLTESIRMCMKYGTVIYKEYFDPFKLDGLGEVCYSIVHPMNFFPDPRAYEIDQMEYCFTAMPKSMEYFVRTWPDKGHLVIPDNEWVNTEQTEGADQPSQEDGATLKEYWFRDEEGNICCMYYAGHIVLQIMGGKYDGSNEPVYRHNRFPFTKQVDYPADKEFWGIGEIEIIELLQRLINNFEAQIIDNTRLMANAQWVVNKVTSGLKEEDTWIFDSRPGNVIWTAQGGVDRLRGESIPRHIPEHMERLIFAMEQILGIHDVVQGRRPAGVRAASAIIALQEAANVRVRQKARHLEYALVDMADKATWLMLEFYDEPRKIRIAGQSEPATLDVRASLDLQIVQDAAEIGMVEPGLAPEEMMEEELDVLRDALKFPEFDIEVKVGPSVPYSQALVYEQAKEFYQLGIIDRKAVLDITGFPNKEEIMKRMEAMEAQVAQQGEGEERIGERTF